MSYRANMEYEDLQVRLQQWVVKNKERLNALCVSSGRGASGYDGLSAAQRDYLCSLLLLQDNMELRAIPPEKQYSRVTITKPETFDPVDAYCYAAVLERELRCTEGQARRYVDRITVDGSVDMLHYVSPQVIEELNAFGFTATPFSLREKT